MTTPSATPIPIPLEPLDPAPLLSVWRAGVPLVRCHDFRWKPTDFFSGKPGSARFSPFAGSASTTAVPALYAADGDDGALLETVLRDVALTGPRQIARADTLHRILAELTVKRDLKLADFSGVGLGRLRLDRRTFIEQGSPIYAATAEWARAVYGDREVFDGMIWVSRQSDRSLSAVLFGERVKSSDVELRAGSTSRPLAFGPGRDALEDLCLRADIDIIDP